MVVHVKLLLSERSHRSDRQRCSIPDRLAGHGSGVFFVLSVVSADSESLSHGFVLTFIAHADDDGHIRAILIDLHAHVLGRIPGTLALRGVTAPNAGEVRRLGLADCGKSADDRQRQSETCTTHGVEMLTAAVDRKKRLGMKPPRGVTKLQFAGPAEKSAALSQFSLML